MVTPEEGFSLEYKADGSPVTVLSLFVCVCVKMSFVPFKLLLNTGLVFQERVVSLMSQ